MLESCGWRGMFDPDNCGFDRDKDKPPGPDARPMYEPNRDLRVVWGKWGPEHITVPGSACGLGLDECCIGGPFMGGAGLTPHNVDSWSQKNLLLLTFLQLASSVIYCSRRSLSVTLKEDT